jgi:TetR/AcrR family transcriptional regulator, repressor of fatR-cypB operon
MSESANKVKVTQRDVRKLVIDASLHLFTQQGYFNTSVPDIVAASNCSTGSIYHHFKDKEGIAKALFESLIERMNIAFDDIEKQFPSAL